MPTKDTIKIDDYGTDCFVNDEGHSRATFKRWDETFESIKDPMKTRFVAPEDGSQTVSNIEIELFRDTNGSRWVFMSNDGSSGVKYPFDDLDDLKEIVSEYIEDLAKEIYF